MSDVWATAQRGDAAKCEARIVAGSDKNWANPAVGLLTPMHVACQKGNLAVVTVLVAKEADVSAPDGRQCTPLMYAARNGHPEVVSLLLKSGAALNARNHRGWTALHFAVNNGGGRGGGPSSAKHLACVQALVEAGADMTIRNSDNKTALQYATGSHGAIAEYLRSVDHVSPSDELAAAGVSAFGPATVGSTKEGQMVMAAMQHDLATCEACIDGGVDKDCAIADAGHATAMHFACQSAALEIVQMLVAKGAGMNALDVNEITPIMYAAAVHPMVGNAGPVVAFLAKSGAALDLRNLDGEAALHIAVGAENLGAVAALAEAGADLSIRNNDGKTAEDLVSQQGSERTREMLKYLQSVKPFAAKLAAVQAQLAKKEAELAAANAALALLNNRAAS